MKTIEEKAKAYDEALERARGLMEGMQEEKCDAQIEDIKNIFPELIESEDERIKRSLINYFKNFNLTTFNGLNPTDIIAWLEKLDSLPTNCSEQDERIRMWLIRLINTAGYRELDTDPMPVPRREVVAWLEKKGEQKPAVWSEEDERIKDFCIAKIEDELDEIRNDVYGHSEIISDLKEGCRERIKWLKSLKDRVQPQSHWKPSEEEMATLRDVMGYTLNRYDSAAKGDYENLHSLYIELIKL